MKKISGKIRTFFKESPLRWYDYLILAAIMIFCFLTYQMSDLYHTAGCSYGFLDGHFLDFYDYLAVDAVGTDGTPGLHASYLPTVYLLFAVWNLPMKLFGIVPKATGMLTFVPLMWAKLLPCLIYLAGGYVFYLITREYGMDAKKARLVTYVYLSNPISLFGQFILGQYESMIIFCVLMGFLFWLRKKTIPFVLWFAVAVTFKYTAILIFVPLVILREKNIWKIVLHVIGVVLLMGLEMAVYIKSPMFRAYAFGIGSAGDNPTGYITNAAYFTGYVGLWGQTFVYVTVVAFAFVCAYAYFKKCDEQSEKAYAVYIVCLAMAALFCLSKWHAHWLMLVVPFWVLSASLHKNAKIWFALDLLFMLFFVIFNVTAFANAHDEILLQSGIFQFAFRDHLINHSTRMAEFLDKLDESMCLSFLTALIGIYAVFKHPKYMDMNFNAPIVKSLGWIRARYILGLMLFIVPSMICVVNSAGYLNEVYGDRYREETVFAAEGSEITQTFVSEGGNIKKIVFPVLKGVEVGEITVRITDEDDQVIGENALNIRKLTTHEFARLKFDTPTEAGKKYTVHFLTNGTLDHDFYYYGCREKTGYEPMTVDGKTKDYHMEMYVYTH